MTAAVSARLTCGCPGELLLDDTRPCTDPATQEDLLCDWCRPRDCPTVDALHWYLGEWANVHHDTPTTNDATARTVKRRGLTPHMGKIRAEVNYATTDGGPRLARSVLYARSMNGQSINETEKPVGVLEPLIAYGCPPGGIVLDPFGGSASTAVAARNLGRRAVVIEKRESQCEKAAQRLAHAPLDFGAVS